MSSENIEKQAQPIVDKFQRDAEAFRAFVADIDAKKKQLEDAYSQFTPLRDKATATLERIEKGGQDSEVAVAQIQSGLSALEGAASRIQAVETSVSESNGKVSAEVQAIQNTKARFETIQEQSEKLSADLTAKQAELQTQVNDIQGKLATLQELEKTLVELKNSAEGAKTGAETAYSQIQGREQEFKSGVDKTDVLYKNLEALQGQVQKKMEDIDDLYADIKGLHETLLVGEKDDDGNASQKSIQSLIEEAHASSNETLQKIQKEHGDQRVAFENLEKELRAKIDRLLPGAGAAGLASSYYAAKLRYSPTNDVLASVDGESRPGLPWHSFATQFLTLAFNYGLFITPLVIIYHQFSELNPTEFSNFSGLLFYKVTLTIPMLGISGFGLASILSNRKLYEEYNYKQRAMELYHSFKKEIEGANDKELQTKLLALMIDVVRDKPSARAARGDRNSKGLLENLQKTVLDVAGKVIPGYKPD